MPDFEEEYTSGIYLNRDETPLDTFLNPVDAAIGGPKYVSVRKLMDGYTQVKSFFESPAGTRVGLKGEPADLVLTYGDKMPPLDGSGTIVTVKTAQGNTTHHDGRIFVKWDSGEFSHYLPEHLIVKNSEISPFYRRAYADLDLTEFMKTSNTDNELVHKASKDLWSYKIVGGKPVIERLFNELDGKPLKC
jgi:hypothetical protein